MKASRFPSLNLALALLLPALTACSHSAATATMTAPAATPVIIVDDAPLPPPITDNSIDSKSTSFLEWMEVQQFMDRLIAKHGFEREQLENFFGNAELTERTIQLMQPAPSGKPKNWQAYRARFIEPIRIEAGLKFWNAHEQALARAEAMYGVPPEIIVGIIGVETLYGKYTGRFRVPDVLTTLAFAYPDTPNRASRMDYFRGEVENVLLLARERQIDPFTLTGSYAGAVGLPQFMPGSIRQYAVDFDGDGRINLLESPVDAIGSVANYLKQHGWQPGAPFAFPAKVSASSEEWGHLLKQGLVAKNTIDELRQSGVQPQEGTPAEFRYGLVDLQNGTEPTEYWVGTPNFFAITHYNRSYFYAMAVIQLGEAIKRQRLLASAN
jgi:membrane-bound lytic murein transglycosylase B